MQSNDSYSIKYITKIFDDDYLNNTAFFGMNENPSISYRDLRNMIINFAGHINNVTKQKQKKIIIFINSGINFVISFYSIIISGNIPILINNKTRSELSTLKGKYDYIIIDEENKKSIISYIDNEQSFINAELIKDDINVPNTFTKEEYNKDDIMLYLFTSGSTGNPKLVEKSYDNIFVEINYLKKLLNVNSSDSFLSLVPSFHIYGLLYSVVLPLFCGCSVLLDIPFSPLNIIEDAILKHDINYVIGIPIHYVSIASFLDRYSKEDFSKIKYCITSTIKIEDWVLEDYHKKTNIDIIEFYGSTETGGIAYRKYNTAWEVFDYVEWGLTDEDILRITSPAVSNDGYDGMFKTNDIVEKIDDKKFILLGRTNQIAKISGNRVSTIEVENVIKQIDFINDCVVTTKDINNKIRKEILIAYVVINYSKNINSNNDEIIKSIKNYCTENLPQFKVPKKISIIDAVPYTSNNKIMYNKLKEMV